jgi:glycosyltransferase involved in cell wall biosynthesis
VDQAISDLTADPGLVARLGAAARARHAEEFTWEHVAGKYEKLLLKALAKYRMQPGQPGRSIRTEAT